jgi:hypothetical protein
MDATPAEATIPLAEPEPESTDAAATERAESMSLSQLAQSVLKLHRELVLSSYTADEESQKLVDQWGRLRIWMEQTGATLETANSLHETLGNDVSLRDSVTDVLRQLLTLLSMAVSMTSMGPTKDSGYMTFNYCDASSTLTSDSEYSSDSQQPDGDVPKKRPPRISRFSLVLSHISEQISLLYHYSAIFRRPRLRGRYLHSSPQRPDFEIPPYEYSHVQQKFRDLASKSSDASPQSGGAALADASADAKAVPAEFNFEREVLSMRIAAANVRRREQLRYWAAHPFDDMEDIMPSPVKQDETDPAPSETTARRSHPATVNTFSSVARSAIFETGTLAGPSRTVYSPSDVGDHANISSARVPKLPSKASQSSTFVCPFCQMTLESTTMKDRNAWKRHVYRDLRPYVCTFPQCSNPDKLYATRREWVYHEMQMHRRQWSCGPCHTSFTAKEQMAAHVRSVHAHQWDERRLPAVLEASEAPASGAEQQACLICSRQFSLSALMDHVAGHMEQLALFALPTGSDELPENGSSATLSSLDSDEEDPSLQQHSTSPHASTNTSDQHGAFVCDQCGRTFDQPHEFKYVRPIHPSSKLTAH